MGYFEEEQEEETWKGFFLTHCVKFTLYLIVHYLLFIFLSPFSKFPLRHASRYPLVDQM